MPNNQKVQNKQLPLRINVALWEKLQQAAAQMECAPSALARELIEKGCDALATADYPRLICVDLVAKPKSAAAFKAAVLKGMGAAPLPGGKAKPKIPFLGVSTTQPALPLSDGLNVLD